MYQHFDTSDHLRFQGIETETKSSLNKFYLSRQWAFIHHLKLATRVKIHHNKLQRNSFRIIAPTSQNILQIVNIETILMKNFYFEYFIKSAIILYNSARCCISFSSNKTNTKGFIGGIIETYWLLLSCKFSEDTGCIRQNNTITVEYFISHLKKCSSEVCIVRNFIY